MAVPTDTLWERDPHTEAKHTLLERYMMAWFPIMAVQFRDQGITFLDGFAGPGEYTNARQSSPLIAMRQAHRQEVTRTGTEVRLVLIEERADRIDHLKSLLDEDYPEHRRSRRLVLKLEQGRLSESFGPAIDEVGGWNGPIFANLDGWGVDSDYEIVKAVAGHRSSEVLVTFQDQFFTRFANVDNQEAGDRVFGFRDWREVASQPTASKKSYLVELYRQRLLEAGFSDVLTFEMIDEGGHSLFQFFGTTSITAVEKFKEGLWQVDGVAGQRFRDPRIPGQASFDIQEPDFSALRRAFVQVLEERGEVSLETLASYALTDTIYKPTHAKPAIDRLLEDRQIEAVKTGRSYADRTYRVAPPSLF